MIKTCDVQTLFRYEIPVCTKESKMEASSPQEGSQAGPWGRLHGHVRRSAIAPQGTRCEITPGLAPRS